MIWDDDPNSFHSPQLETCATQVPSNPAKPQATPDPPLCACCTALPASQRTRPPPTCSMWASLRREEGAAKWV